MRDEKIEILKDWIYNMDSHSKNLLIQEYDIMNGDLIGWINELDECSMDDLIAEYNIE